MKEWNVEKATNVEKEITLTGKRDGERTEFEIGVRAWHGQGQLSIRTHNGWANVPLNADTAGQLEAALAEVRSMLRRAEGA